LNSKDIVFNKCTNHDFGKLLENLDETFVVYLDPPYFVKGSELYHHSFEEQDHIRLSEYLKKTKAYWVLSYDNCDYIVDLYKDWSNINVITGINYTINTSRKDKFELLISNF
jgi:DNA adenine methylase